MMLPATIERMEILKDPRDPRPGADRPLLARALNADSRAINHARHRRAVTQAAYYPALYISRAALSRGRIYTPSQLLTSISATVTNALAPE
jgi:hypothetical protein